MGQKVNPHGLRVGVIKDWDSKWYAEADFADCLIEDHKIRTFLKKRLYSAGVSKIEIERASDRVKIIIYTAKPGVVIGKGGAEIEKVKVELQKFTDKKLVVDIKEVRLSLNIDTHDFNTKLNNALKFIKHGDKVKVSIRFRGREMGHPEIGLETMKRFADACSETAVVEKPAKLEGRNMLMFLAPKTNK